MRRITADGVAVEHRAVDIVAVLKDSIRIPIAVKLSPFCSSLPHLAATLDDLGANALVLFNRFYQPDIDPDRRSVTLALRHPETFARGNHRHMLRAVRPLGISRAGH